MDWLIHAETEPVNPREWSDQIEGLLEVLDEVAGVSHATGWSSAGGFGATFVIRGRSAVEALTEGHNGFRAALDKLGIRRAVQHLEVAPVGSEEPEFVGATDIAAILNISRQRVYQLLRKPDFPPPARRLARGSLWNRWQIETWASTARKRSA
jgi:predicted DNA-binding transcriptional regulator AlpA